MSLSEVSSALWRQRELLRLLRLDQRGSRPDADERLGLGLAELARAVAVSSVTRSLGLEPGSSLRELASVAPAPWDRILREHLDALRAVAPPAAQPSLVEFLR